MKLLLWVCLILAGCGGGELEGTDPAPLTRDNDTPACEGGRCL